MATTATLTINAADIIGADFDPSRASVWIETNTEHSLIRVDGTEVRVGGRSEKFVNGVATFVLVTTDSADDEFAYRGCITYIEKGSREQGRKSLPISDFPFTASANLAAIPEAWDNIVIPASWRSEFRDEMETLRDQAEAAKDEATDLSGIATPDATIANRVSTAGSATELALRDRDPVYLIHPTGTNDQAKIRDAVLAGNTNIELAEGTFAWDASITTWSTGVKLRGQGEGKTIIQLSATTQFGPTWRGTRTQVGADNVTGNLTAGATTITTATDLTASIAAGDRLVVTSGAYFASRTFHNVGEWLLVKAITSTTITLAAPLRYSYATADTIKLEKYVLVSGARLEGVTLRGHAGATVRQTLAELRYCDSPVVDARVEGARVTVGIELRECMTPNANVVAWDVKDLANSVINTYEGYGVRTRGCVDARINVTGGRCRHMQDDSSLTREPPSLRTHVTGIGVDCISSGFSTHGGSDECFFDGTAAINCGGGYIVRGKAPKGRAIVVQGIRNPATDEYTAIGGALQSYKHGLTVGEFSSVGTTGGITSPGGVGLDWEFLTVDMSGGDSTCNAISGEYADWSNARIRWGAMTLRNAAGGLIARYTDLFRNVKILGGYVRNFGTSRVVYIEPRANADGRGPQNVLIEELDVDGYNTVVINVVGNSVAGANASKGIVIRRNRARNKDAAYGAGSSVWRLEAGYFATGAGSVRIQDNDHSESLSSAIKHDLTNGGTGLGSAIVQKGNLNSAGFDTAP